MVTGHQYTGRTSYLLAQYGTGLPSYTNIGLQYTWPHGSKLAGANNVPGHTASTQTNGQHTKAVNHLFSSNIGICQYPALQSATVTKLQ